MTTIVCALLLPLTSMQLAVVVGDDRQEHSRPARIKSTRKVSRAVVYVWIVCSEVRTTHTDRTKMH